MPQQHTASGTKKSIWGSIPEERFLQTVNKVFVASKQIAGAPQAYDTGSHGKRSDRYVIPYQVEYQVAQDLAFIAANEEHANKVSAISITEDGGGKGISVHIASNAGVEPLTRKIFSDISNILQQCARKEINSVSCAQQLLDLIVILDQSKIIGRLRCKRWVPPSKFASRPPSLSFTLEAAVHDIIRSNRGHRSHLDPVVDKIESLVKQIDDFDGGNSVDRTKKLSLIIRSAGDVIGWDSSLELFLKKTSIHLSARNEKAIKAFDKLANYWHLCVRLSRIARKSSLCALFGSIRLHFLEHYTSHKVNGFQRYVHAEVQLAVYHRQQKTLPGPRVIGTSKAACYLCDLFLSHHQYSISATHGMLYEYWTIPDLINYTDEDRIELKSVIRRMHGTLVRRSKSPLLLGSLFPVQSGIYRPSYVPSLAATATSLTGSVDRDSSPVATLLSITEQAQAQELKDSVIVRTHSPPITIVENATGGTSALPEHISIAISAKPDRIIDMPALQECREGQTGVELLATRSLSQDENQAALSLPVSPIDSIAASSGMHDRSPSSVNHDMVHPINISPQEEISLPALTSQQDSETNVQKPLRKRRHRRRRRDHRSTVDNQSRATQHRHASTRSKRVDRKPKRRGNERGIGNETKVKTSNYFQKQTSFKQRLSRIIKKLSGVLCGLDMKPRQLR